MTAKIQFPVPAPAKAARARVNLLLTTIGLVATWLCTVLPAGDALAATSPSQVPLYSAVPGAKPNLMFVLDNSGSMAFEAQDGYSVNNDCKGDEEWWRDCGGKSGWYSNRSSDVNTQYYDPSITYAARVNSSGTKLDNPIVFVDNQSSSYSNYTPSALIQSPYTTAASASGKNFTYVLCAGGNCSSSGNRRVVNISYPPGTGTVTLPTGHKRTECGNNATSCTAELERQNIVNWYQWYRTRTLAVSTALGQAMQNYENKFRVGYVQYNINGNAAGRIISGAHYFKDEDTIPANNWKTKFYDWIYGINPSGGTPSHNALNLAANYYSGQYKTTYGNPWKNDPTSSAATDGVNDLSCRRAYSIVLSDGAWNNGTSQNAANQYASTTGTNYTGKPSGNTTSLQYDPSGAADRNSTDLVKKFAARNLYIPYGDGGKSSFGFADLTARYFWNTDFSSELANNVPPIEGQHNPTFWQNMTTFTIGWGLTPSGGDTGTSTKLTWEQINTYNNNWLAGSAATQPKWTDSGNNVDLDSNRTSDSLRVNDFIRAGFTGGGRAYSVYSGDDVRRALDNALSGMVGAGNDAGVAVSGNSSEFQTLENQYKYTTEYQTVDNTGDIKAFQLNAVGGYLNVQAGKPVPAWSANTKMPAVANRKIFSLSNYDASQPASAVNKRIELNYNTTLDSLPTDFKVLLNADSLQRLDTSFIRYMLGQDPQTDINGTIYRSRKQPIGASVNSPPVFVGGRIDMGYSIYGAVDGKDLYAAYKAKKTSLPPTIFAATNNGKVHVLNAAKDDTAQGGIPVGTELAEFMPKGAMASQIDLANTNFRFRYTLDGPLVEQDVYDGNSRTPAGGAAAWRQVVVGTGGRAGNFMYGLESPMNAADRIPTKNHFLWELSDKTTDYGDLANVTNNPTAGQLNDGTWVVLSGSGQYGGKDKKVGLYVVEALTGKRRAFIPLPAGFGSDAADGGNRGLGGVVAVRDTSRKIVAAYAGDANGNLWRFDLRVASFGVSYNRPLFTTPGGKTQPIYATPTWQTHPGDASACTYSTTSQCGAIVVVGTGILLDEDDLKKPATKQAIYGIWDQTPIGGGDKAGFGKITLTDLVTQTIDLASAKDGTGIEAGKKFYQVSSNSVDWKTKKGWLLNLGVIPYTGTMTDGERVVGDLANLGSSVIITSFLPEDKNLSIESCTATGSLPNIIYVLDALTGKNKYSFDVDSNGSFDLFSIVSIPAGGFTRGNVSSRSLIGQPNEGRPDLKPDSDCTNETGYLTGVGGTQKAGDGCAAKGWRRSWRSVVSPPF